MKSIDMSNGEFDSLKATAEVWAKAKHHAPTSENLQRSFVVGYMTGCRACGMGVHETLSAAAGAEAADQDCYFPPAKAEGRA